MEYVPDSAGSSLLDATLTIRQMFPEELRSEANEIGFFLPGHRPNYGIVAIGSSRIFLKSVTGCFDERSIIAEGLFYLAGLLDDKGFHDGLAFRAYYASVSLGIRTLRS